MPASNATGIGGIEARHEWNGGFVLNNHVVVPQARLEKITGLHSLPESDDVREPWSGGQGELVFPSYKRGRTILYEGTIYGFDHYTMATHRWAMLQAFDDQNNEYKMRVIPAEGGGPVWYYYARVIHLDIDDEVTVSIQEFLGGGKPPYRRTFKLGLRQSDPTYTLEV